MNVRAQNWGCACIPLELGLCLHPASYGLHVHKGIHLGVNSRGHAPTPASAHQQLGLEDAAYDILVHPKPSYIPRVIVTCPVPSVRQSPEVRVWNENTAVAALVEWVAGPVGQRASLEQRRQLAGCLRLQHCTHSYLAHMLPQVCGCVAHVQVLQPGSGTSGSGFTGSIRGSRKPGDGRQRGGRVRATRAGAGPREPGQGAGGTDCVWAVWPCTRR